LTARPNDLPRRITRIHVECRPQLEVIAEVQLVRRQTCSGERPVYGQGTRLAFEHVELQALFIDAIGGDERCSIESVCVRGPINALRPIGLIPSLPPGIDLPWLAKHDVRPCHQPTLRGTVTAEGHPG